MDELIIDNNNFHEYFFPVSDYGPKPGQVMSRYITKAELINGEDKGYLIDLLTSNPLGAEMGVQLAKKLFGATEVDAINLCKMIASDLISGKTREEVMDKPYSYTFERFFWTKEEYVPKGDPHWQVIHVTFVVDEKIEESMNI